MVTLTQGPEDDAVEAALGTPRKGLFVRYVLAIGGTAALLAAFFDLLQGYRASVLVEGLTGVGAFLLLVMSGRELFLRLGLRFVLVAAYGMFAVSAVTQFDSTTTLIWVGVYPPVFFFLTNIREGLLWSLACLVTLPATYALYPLFFDGPRIPPMQVVEGAIALSVAAAIAVFYERLRQQQHTMLLHLAQDDALTGIYNRRTLYRRMEQEVERQSRYGGRFSLLLVDIDEFKCVNDTWGHVVGDDLLVRFVERLSRSIRETDVFARWGGEEFAILAPGTEIGSATELAGKLRRVLANEEFDRVGRITASFGVAEYRPGEDLDRLVSRADHALYEAKRTRNTVVAHEDGESPASACIA